MNFNIELVLVIILATLLVTGIVFASDKFFRWRDSQKAQKMRKALQEERKYYSSGKLDDYFN